MASSDSKERKPRANRPTLTINLVDVETQKAMRLKIGASTSPSSIQSVVSSRLLGSQFSTTLIVKKPVGVIIDEVCIPFENIYETLLAVEEDKRRTAQYEVLFEILSAPTASSSSSGSSLPTLPIEDASGSDNRHPYLFQPIGYISSCWPRKNGCPRQGMLAPHTQASLKLLPPPLTGSSVSVADALDGVGAFSHVWLIFVFHANQEPRESGSDAVGSGHVRAKVHPPRLGGKSIGVYATRSPHRFVPIGLTAAKLERVDGDTIYLSGVDLIDNTPILDIKPYVPGYDSIPSASIGQASEWVAAPSTIEKVDWLPIASENLLKLAPLCRLFVKDPKLIQAAVEETLLADPRSVYRKTKCADKNFGFRVDQLSIQCSVQDNQATVLDVTLHQAQESSNTES
jgi:tRNA-Thr(GGU) m(6)t(6)A37 methyltransferase TsaA